MKFFTLFLCLSTTLHAATIGILDTGVDYKHRNLTRQTWTNPGERHDGVDNDHNGFVDDLFGWNLIDNNGELLNWSLYGTFDELVYRYYHIRARKNLGTATEAELQWLKDVVKDEEFDKQLSTYRSWIHGTHVAGIASGQGKNQDIEFIMVKYLGSAKSGVAKEPEFKPIPNGSRDQKLSHIRRYLDLYIPWQIGKLKAGIDYAAANGAQIINGSFGKSHKGSISMIANLYEEQFGKKPSEQEESLIESMSTIFMAKLIESTEILIRKYSGILFVFSAGNSKQDTDEFLHYPSNARNDNVISVGASLGHHDLASFSNFGKNTVDVHAPGVAIMSSVPEDKQLPASGTSQAAPYITNLAAQMKARAIRLKIQLDASTLKKIILESVDIKEDLMNKSVSTGIANPARALKTVSLLSQYSLPTALKKARKMVRDIPVIKTQVAPEMSAEELPEPF